MRIESKGILSNQPEASSDNESTGSMPMPHTAPKKGSDSLQPVQVPFSLGDAKINSAPNSDNCENPGDESDTFCVSPEEFVS